MKLTREKISSLYESNEIKLDKASEEVQEMNNCFTGIKHLFADVNVYESWRDKSLYIYLPNVPCKCSVCTRKQHDILWCERIVRQREALNDEYTCPGCQKSISKDIFEEHHDICIKIV